MFSVDAILALIIMPAKELDHFLRVLPGRWWTKQQILMPCITDQVIRGCALLGGDSAKKADTLQE
jgi:hypothetical protein